MVAAALSLQFYAARLRFKALLHDDIATRVPKDSGGAGTSRSLALFTL